MYEIAEHSFFDDGVHSFLHLLFLVDYALLLGFVLEHALVALVVVDGDVVETLGVELAAAGAGV